MNKNMLDKIEMVLNDNDFSVTHCETQIEIETWTGGGVNMIIYVDKETPIEDFTRYIDSFEIDEEIDLYRESRDYCNNFTIRESLEDFEEYKTLLNEVYKQLNGLERNGK